jgi:hypothetical protein
MVDFLVSAVDTIKNNMKNTERSIWFYDWLYPGLFFTAFIILMGGCFFSIKDELQWAEYKKSPTTIKSFDYVVMDGLDVTGRVNTIWREHRNILTDIIVKNTNGTVQLMNAININLLRKISVPEK